MNATRKAETADEPEGGVGNIELRERRPIAGRSGARRNIKTTSLHRQNSGDSCCGPSVSAVGDLHPSIPIKHHRRTPALTSGI